MPLIHVDGCESEDEELVTVVEKEKIDVDKKVVIVTDKFRTVEKMLMPENLQDFLNQGKLMGDYMHIRLTCAFRKRVCWIQ